MLGKIFSLSFNLLFGLIGFILKISKRGVSFVFGTLRVIISRIFAALFGAIIGFFLGSGHIGIRIFKKRKKD